MKEAKVKAFKLTEKLLLDMELDIWMIKADCVQTVEETGS